MTLHKSQEERRRDILDAARERFVTDGYSRARLNDVAADAGLSKGGVYFHFRSKREIFDALVDEDFQRVMGALGAMRKVTGNTADKLIFFAQAGFRVALANPTIAKFQVVMGEMALAADDVGDRLREIHEQFVAEVADVLREGVGRGELRADLDTETGARLLVTLMDGVRIAVAGAFHKSVEFEKLIADGARLLVEGFLPGAGRGA
ncbi:MAG: TetR/AcrR family transcriptional regulator [Myxococcales bacterium]|nr:TetR/AcrR family transcriptional regulator [Myxococcales bacterium]MCB9735475.1 TetR/AcrR family transcriptional regulator [Deltaproteobacteria bacterium]